MPSDFPLMPEENPPHVRRRIGASFKLDESLILHHKEVQEKRRCLVVTNRAHLFIDSFGTGHTAANAGNRPGCSPADL